MGDSITNSNNPQEPDRYGPRSPEGAIIVNKYDSPEGLGLVEERRSCLYLGKEPKVPPEIAETLEFGIQLFIGKPGQGHIVVLNPGVINDWQNGIADLAKQPDAGPIIKLDSLAQLAQVHFEEGVHSCIIDQGVHPIEARGTCVHDQKVWYSKQHQLSYGTCKCRSSFKDNSN